MKVSDEQVEIAMMNELIGLDQGEFKQKLRKIKPTFSNDIKFKKDVQVVIDENFIN